MKQFFILVFFLFCCFTSKPQINSNKLWYRQPAKVWEEALPVGNGRLGAMIFGDPGQEVIQLNEESIWAGSKINNNNLEAITHLKELQAALFKSNYKDALELADKYFLGTPPRKPQLSATWQFID